MGGILAIGTPANPLIYMPRASITPDGLQADAWMLG